MTPVRHLDSGAIVVLEGKPRQKWRHSCPTEWHLDGIWPSSHERAQILRALRVGQSALIIQNSEGESVDLLDEELSVRVRGISDYIIERERGVTSLFVPSMSWLPARIATSATAFIREQTRVHAAAGDGKGSILTPPLGLRKNIRVLHLETAATTELAADCLENLAEVAFPKLLKGRRKL